MQPVKKFSIKFGNGVADRMLLCVDKANIFCFLFLSTPSLLTFVGHLLSPTGQIQVKEISNDTHLLQVYISFSRWNPLIHQDRVTSEGCLTLWHLALLAQRSGSQWFFWLVKKTHFEGAEGELPLPSLFSPLLFIAKQWLQFKACQFAFYRLLHTIMMEDKGHTCFLKCSAASVQAPPTEVAVRGWRPGWSEI